MDTIVQEVQTVKLVFLIVFLVLLLLIAVSVILSLNGTDQLALPTAL